MTTPYAILSKNDGSRPQVLPSRPQTSLPMSFDVDVNGELKTPVEVDITAQLNHAGLNGALTAYASQGWLICYVDTNKPAGEHWYAYDDERGCLSSIASRDGTSFPTVRVIIFEAGNLAHEVLLAEATTGEQA